MNTEPMITLKPHRYGTKELVAGDSFKASKRDVNLLEALGRAKRDEESLQQPVAQPARRAPRQQNRNQSRNSSRRYNRRDMHAKD